MSFGCASISAIVNANKILVLKQGEIVEQSRHAELPKRGGVYYNLHNMQFMRKSDAASEEGKAQAFEEVFSDSLLL